MQYIQKAESRSTILEKMIGLTEARKQFSGIVNEVMYQGDTYVIEKQGKPAAAVVPMDVYEQWRRRRERFFDLIRDPQEQNLDVDAASIMQDVLDAQQALRSQHPSSS
jgi:prevent-host-death family protein